MLETNYNFIDSYWQTLQTEIMWEHLVSIWCLYDLDSKQFLILWLFFKFILLFLNKSFVNFLKHLAERDIG